MTLSNLKLWLVGIFVVSLWRQLNCYCNESLGLESRRIRNSQLIASNSGAGTTASDARYNNGSGWCVLGQPFWTRSFFKDNYHLQVDLLELHKISGIILQGSAKYRGYSYGSTIKLQYKDANADVYSHYMELRTSALKFPNAEYIQIEPPFVARYVRYLPQLDQNPKCVKFELFGCAFKRSGCKEALLTESLGYTESSYYTRSRSKFLGKYIASTVSVFPWGPNMKSSISYPYQEYVQIDMHQMVLIRGIQTMRPNYAGKELDMPKVLILQFRGESGNWFNVSQSSGQLIEFNTETSLIQISEIKPAFKARYIKILPRLDNHKQVYLKLQMYGCLLKDAFKLVSKTTDATSTFAATHALQTTMQSEGTKAPVSYHISSEVEINSYEIRQGNTYTDRHYIGKSTKDVLHDGKGILVDGVRGVESPSKSPSIWVGWNKKFVEQPYIIINFQSVIALNTIDLVSYVDMEKKMGLFASATILFQRARSPWTSKFYVCPQKHTRNGPVIVTIDLANTLADRIKIAFNYSMDWFVLSEITLNRDENKKNALIMWKSQCKVASYEVVRGKESSSSMLLIILVVVLVVILLAVLTILLYRYRKKISTSLSESRRKYKKRKEKSSIDEDCDEIIVSFKKGLSGNGTKEPDHMYVEVKENKVDEAEKPFLPRFEDKDNVSAHPCEFDDVVYASPDETIDHNPIGYTEVTVEGADQSPSPNYSMPGSKAASSSTVELNPIYAGSQVYEDPYQTVTGSSLYADPQMEEKDRTVEIRKFPRSRLRFIEKIGVGQFGEVHICEVDALGSIVDIENNCSWRMTSTTKVAVKRLKTGVDQTVEREFMKEVRVMARLKHDNVVQLLGVCDEEPKCMVVEYMENGDLNQFLKGYDGYTNSQYHDLASNCLNEGILLHICMQIAAGMKYLSSQGFIHRDLATRNCLVGHSFTVKISDFGMSRYLYSKQYYRIEGRAVLPIRWMAPESLYYGTFTSQTDVWAFGVTLWEVFTLAKKAPYSHLTDQQVIENACSVVSKQRKAMKCLSQPVGCSYDIYEVLLQCWERSPIDRPSFDELFRFFLKRSSSIEASV